MFQLHQTVEFPSCQIADKINTALKNNAGRCRESTQSSGCATNSQLQTVKSKPTVFTKT